MSEVRQQISSLLQDALMASLDVDQIILELSDGHGDTPQSEELVSNFLLYSIPCAPSRHLIESAIPSFFSSGQSELSRCASKDSSRGIDR